MLNAAVAVAAVAVATVAREAILGGVRMNLMRMMITTVTVTATVKNANFGTQMSTFAVEFTYPELKAIRPKKNYFLTT
jgi:hypothetical protein